MATSARNSRTTTALVYFGFALTGVATTLLGTALPALTQRLHLSDLQDGYLFAAQFLSSTLGVALSGRLVSGSGFKHALVVGFTLIAAGIAALAFVAWPGCLVAVAAYGTGLGIAIPACNLQVAAANPDRRASALNILNFVWTGGALAWAPFGARVSMHPLSFVVLGFGIAIFAVCIAFAAFAEATAAPERPKIAQARRVPTSVFLMTAIMFFLYIGVENAWSGWATTYAQRLNPANDNWTYAPAFFWAALLAGRALAPFILKRISEDALLLLDLAAATIAGFIFLAAPSLALLFPALTVVGFALASVYPNLIARMTREFDNARAGYMFACAAIGGATLPWAVGAASTHFGGIRTGLLIPLVCAAIMLGIHVYRLFRTSVDSRSAVASA